MSKKTSKSQKMAENKKGKKEEHSYELHKNLFREVIEVLLYGLALLIFFKGFVFQNFQIPTSSMENTLLIGDHITANTFVLKKSSNLDKTLLPFREIKRGDVIVFKWPGNEQQDWIKRCVGLPGDRFAIKQDRVYINGELLKETYPFFKMHRGVDDRDKNNKYYPLGYEESKPGFENHEDLKGENITMARILVQTRAKMRESFKGRTGSDYERIMARFKEGASDVIPPGFFLMLGDNRNNSFDSRYWGLVPRELIQGRAWFVWWSYGEEVGSHKKKGFDLIMSYLQVPFTIWTRTRFGASFKMIR